jgi:hypothetical protein
VAEDFAFNSVKEAKTAKRAKKVRHPCLAF